MEDGDQGPQQGRPFHEIRYERPLNRFDPASECDCFFGSGGLLHVEEFVFECDADGNFKKVKDEDDPFVGGKTAN